MGNPLTGLGQMAAAPRNLRQGGDSASKLKDTNSSKKSIYISSVQSLRKLR